MSAPEVTVKLVAAIESGKYDAIICNYANCETVGHSGLMDGAIKADEAVDDSLEKVLAAVKKVGGDALVTADHGNVEEMFDEETGQPHTQHSTLPVPFIFVSDRKATMANGGSLADVAPTMLALLDLPQPKEMTGRNLVTLG